MVVTHVLVGLALAVPVAVLAPEFSVPAGVGALVGGTLPDLDLLVGDHRRTLHAPVLGSVAAVGGCAAAVAAPGRLSVAVAALAVAAAVHSASDALGAGEELRPWERTNPDAVYDHVRGRWIRARYVVPYDGSPRDLLVAAVAAAPVLVVYDGPIRAVAVGLLAVGTAYTAVRKRLPPYFERFVD